MQNSTAVGGMSSDAGGVLPDGGILSGEPFAESSVRPLRKGYKDLAAFFSPYISSMREGTATTPTLPASLRHLAANVLVTQPLGKLPVNAKCLVQGYSSPDGAAALRLFLSALGIRTPRLWAVDLYDLPAVYAGMGLPQPEMDFHIADATALPGSFKNGMFDLVVQDFLLNCLPPANYARLLNETARVLSPTGLAIINFSDAASVRNSPQWTWSELANLYGVMGDDNAYQLEDLACRPEWRARLKSQLGSTVVAGADGESYTFIVPSNGRFEFFPKASHIFTLLRRVGMKLLVCDQSEGVDANGLKCWRNRCLVCKIRAPE